VAVHDLLIIGDDGRARCRWGDAPPRYRLYHDEEWGRPVADDIALFEKLALEGFQAGLSWLTILNKRENFRRAFCGFDFHRIAGWGEPEIAALMEDPGIVRHRGKITATISNARAAVELTRAEGSLAAFIWRFEPGTDAAPTAPATAPPSASQASRALARELKRRGWCFLGPTTVHSFLQAMGLVNEHVHGCHVHPAVEADRAAFIRPG
jgi:DNA-3-methyladenine glycosylase I